MYIYMLAKSNIDLPLSVQSLNYIVSHLRLNLALALEQVSVRFSCGIMSLDVIMHEINDDSTGWILDNLNQGSCTSLLSSRWDS